MTAKPNAVLLTSINGNAHAEENLRKQRGMVVSAITAWSPGGYCHAEKMHIKGYSEEQKAYFDEALILIDKHLKKFRGTNNG
ncbi:hypothetical protein [Yersinia pseudotuberculosis]|uniref:hypothetical protein n=1 Tax=Yersinia pseudotuberculosis TaxID=633 RepID=UPI0018FF3000|nr:hypothetical protein [Yersinia pseudotuberculosis]MBK1423829.1 hypothetical protein [Yersinia pseudotuberculosis]